MSLMFQPLIKYADFDGRARRTEYWLFHLLCLLLSFGGLLLTLIVAGIAGLSSNGGTNAATSGAAIVTMICILLLMLAWLALIVPSIALTIRRLHDIDKPGVWILIAFAPLVGGIILLIFTLTDGTPGPNQYGPDPKNRAPLPPFTPAAPVEVHHYHYGSPPAASAPAGPDASV